MLDPNDGFPRQRLVTMQIIAGSLVMGVVMFLGVAVFLVSTGRGGPAPNPALPMISYVALAMLVVNTPMALVVPRSVTEAGLKRIAAQTRGSDPTESLIGLRQSALIISLALLEGCAFTACIGYLVEAEPLALGVAAAVIFMMSTMFPTERSLRAWLEVYRQRVAELQQGNP
jgi:hypothetical protein